MMDGQPLVPEGLLPPPGLFAVLCWPFLVALLLWASGRTGQGRGLALAGAVMSLLALVLFPHGLSFVQTAALGLEACAPFLLFLTAPAAAAPWQTYAPAQAGARNWEDFSENASLEVLERERPPLSEAERREEGVAERLPFLVTGCALMALSIRSVLAVTVALGAGAVVLAWWDGRGARRAKSAWDMVRVRLCGVILSAFGAALLQALPVSPDSAQGATLSAVMLVVGLGMMAGLGEPRPPAPSFGLLEAGLRFGALFLLLQLAVSPLTQELTLLAGLAGLWLAVLGSGKTFPLLSVLTALGALAAGACQENALLLLFCAALLCSALQRLEERVSGARLASWCAVPVLCVVLIMLGRALPWGVTALAVAAVAWGLRSLAFRFPGGLSRERDHRVGIDAPTFAPTSHERRLAFGLCGALFAVALAGAFAPPEAEALPLSEDEDGSEEEGESSNGSAEMREKQSAASLNTRFVSDGEAEAARGD